MLKRVGLSAGLQKLNTLAVERKQVKETLVSPAAPEASAEAIGSVTEESLATTHSVQAEQSTKHSVSDQNRVEKRQSAKRSLSKMHTVQKTHSEGFTMVPHALLRVMGQFTDPIDFMVYLHLFTYSHGFHRDTAEMGQAQLEMFTGASKNTVKRSLDRLQDQKWIALVEEYEHARICRKWRVRAPKGMPPRGKKISTEVDTDSVQAGQGENVTTTVAKLDQMTVSRSDTFLEREVNKSKKSDVAVEREWEADFSEHKLAFEAALPSVEQRRMWLAKVEELYPYFPKGGATSGAMAVELWWKDALVRSAS